MSWSVNYIGQPEAVVSALEQEGTKWDGQSKTEFEAARPILTALVKENFSQQPNDGLTLHLEASGHGYVDNGQQMNRSLSVNLKTVYCKLV